MFLLDKPMETRKAMQEPEAALTNLYYINTLQARCQVRMAPAKTVRKIRQGRLRLDADLRARRRTQVLDRFIVPSHMTDANASSIDVWALMMHILGCARRVLKFQRTRQRRRPRGQIL